MLHIYKLKIDFRPYHSITTSTQVEVSNTVKSIYNELNLECNSVASVKLHVTLGPKRYYYHSHYLVYDINMVQILIMSTEVPAHTVNKIFLKKLN